MKLKIWSKRPQPLTKTKENIPWGRIPPTFETELEGGEVILIEDKNGNSLFHMELGLKETT